MKRLIKNLKKIKDKLEDEDRQTIINTIKVLKTQEGQIKRYQHMKDINFL